MKAKMGFSGLYSGVPSSSVLAGLPVASGTTMHIKNCIRTAQVAMYMPSCTQPCGAPLLLVIKRARMRVPTKRIESIGQYATVPIMLSIVFWSNGHSNFVNSLTVTPTQMPMYTKKNWKVKLITHCIVTEIGGVYCAPCGCWIVNTE